MALFKILKGDSSRIDTSTTPFHDGYAYFTPDDGGFYIDSENNGVQKRIRINPASTTITETLLSSGWNSGRQTLTIQGVTTDSNGMIGIAHNATEDEMTAARDAELYICDQGTNSLTIAASGDVPTCDIPVVIVLVD